MTIGEPFIPIHLRHRADNTFTKSSAVPRMIIGQHLPSRSTNWGNADLRPVLQGLRGAADGLDIPFVQPSAVPRMTIG